MLDVATGTSRRRPEDIIAAWLPGSGPVLLAMDAPLGWPLALGAALLPHKAGESIPVGADDLFHRHTDTVIQQRLSKRPLEVGANLIARTAHAALGLLGRLRRLTGLEIPLAWDPMRLDRISAIEVYPAATRIGRAAPGGPGSLEGLEQDLLLPESRALEASPDARDAVVCALAGADFLRGLCLPPDDMALAQKEGWIWVRR